MELQIYELADIAAILDLEKSRVKNWTIGRPFSVHPSVRASFGKGSRNLFSRNDVYCFALVKRLNEIGAPVAAIQQMLQELSDDLAEETFWKDERDWLIIRRNGHGFSSKIDVYDDSFGYINIMLRREDEIVCSYGVNLTSIADATSAGIAGYFGRQTTRSTSAQKSGKKKRPRR